ncbi:hypothetical protein GM3709_589 [Geminocystis sp. NIES-3709]|nr:hypothetical protein GM3709_589 [Geminocystis sp. NIES-3709]
MNKLKLQNKIYSFDNDDHAYFVTMIFVDGEVLTDFSYYATSLTQLSNSIVKDGEYFIITCWCGVPECAGIEQGIKVTHHQNTVKWTINQPQRQQFTFSTHDYKTAISEGIKQIKEDLLIHRHTVQKLEIVPNQEEYNN